MKFKTAIAAMIVSAFALPVLAQTTAPAKDPAATPGIDQGVKSGELTQKEAARLEKGQDKVQKVEDKAKADGVVTAKERKRIHKVEDNQSKKIYREKHDRQHDRNHDGKMDRPGRK